MGGKKKGRQKQSKTSLLQDFPITGCIGEENGNTIPLSILSDVKKWT